jgi:GNAT superfamily N-acetyltransferase
MNWRKTWLRAWQVARQEGARPFWFRLCSALGYRRLVFFELPSGTGARFPFPEGVTWGPLSADGWEDYQHLRPDIKVCEWELRLRHRHRCFCARFRGQIIAATWVAQERAWVDYLGWELPLGPGEAYVYDSFALEQWRGCGLGSALSSHVSGSLPELGIETAWRAVMPENVAAVALQIKLGSKPAWLQRSLRLGPWVWHHRSELACSG